ncbi:MAG TPA: glycerol kinase GlpK [Terriglobales bacterium]|nr:glycerol kinase GlpK [Terriglobales bacterium]
MAYILSLDQGTTSSRAIVFDEHGGVVASAQREFPQIYPQAGWVEHDPEAILGAQLEAAAEAIERASHAGAAARQLAGIGIANQRETAIVWDRETGQPIYNAIVWQDRRTAEHCDRLRAEGAEAAVREKTGLVIDSYFSGTKISWILDHVAGARQRAEAGKLAFGTVDSWLIWNLTGGQRHVTDFTNASRTMLFNIRTGQWDAELLRLLRVPESLMPEVVASSGRIATTKMTATASSGLGAVTLAGMAGDQQAALLGQLCLTPGEAKNTYGTGCFLLKHIGGKFVLSSQRLVTTLACSLDGKLAYALEGSVFIGGAVVQWLRDNLKLIRNSAEIGALARTVPDNGGVVLVPAFVGLGAPHWDPYAGGLLIGLRRDTQPGHIARAAEECIAFQVADVVEAMDRETGEPVGELRVDGGAAVDDLLLQFQADLLGIPVVRPANTETTALGAAYLAGLAVGVWDGAGALRHLRRDEVRFTPRLDRGVAAALRRRWQAAVARSRGWDQP